jgi:hypothetical protein
VRPDGGASVAGREGEVFKVTQCMNEYVTKAVKEGRVPAEKAMR